ncbi:MAG: hypothetical protein AB1898_08340 [Acidobacteriota bacterium]
MSGPGLWGRPARARVTPLLLLVLLLAASPIPTLSKDRPKKEKFRGFVVAAGPKAISVKSEKNIYQVRMFHYTADLERRIRAKPPVRGEMVTVHYYQGTDLAFKVN